MRVFARKNGGKSFMKFNMDDNWLLVEDEQLTSESLSLNRQREDTLPLEYESEATLPLQEESEPTLLLEQESESTIALAEESKPTLPLIIEESPPGQTRNECNSKQLYETHLKYGGKLVAVAGASKKTGATTQALQVSLYLQNCGYRVAYVEGKRFPDICNVIRQFSQGMLVEDSELGFIRYDQLSIFYHFQKIDQVLDKEYDYFVLDLGCYNSEAFSMEWFKRCDYKIIVCGVGGQQYEDTKKVFESTSAISNCSYIFSSISEENRQFVREFVQERILSTTFAIKVTNPFRYSAISNSTYQPIFHLLDDQDTLVLEEGKARKGKRVGIIIAASFIGLVVAAGFRYADSIKEEGDTSLTTLDVRQTSQPSVAPSEKTTIVLVESNPPAKSCTPDCFEEPMVIPKITATPTLAPKPQVEPTIEAVPTVEETVKPKPTEDPESVETENPLGSQEAKPTSKPTLKATAKPTTVPKTVAVKQITLPSAVRMVEGGTLTLEVGCEPSNATDKNFSWKSSNTKVVTVKNGKIKAIKKGKATVTVKSSNGKTANCTVVVSDQ